MDFQFQRILLFVALAFVLLMLWQAWQHDYGPHPATQVAQKHTATAPSAGSSAAVPSATPSAPTASAAKPSVPVAADTLDAGQMIDVYTDLMHYRISTRGGDVREVALLKYPEKAGQPKNPVRLLHDTPPKLFVAQSGLRATAGPQPDHRALFVATQRQYHLATGAKSLAVTLTWQDASGLKVEKIYTFHRGSYVADLTVKVMNSGDTSWHGYFYTQLQRTPPPKKSHLEEHTYVGGAIYSPKEKYEKVTFEEMKKLDLDRTITGGWAAMVQHYFTAAWIPPGKQQEHFYSMVANGDRYVLGMYSDTLTVPAGAEHTFTSRLFAGPKLQDRLANIAPGLELTTDYGILTFIAKPIFWLLKELHAILGNWGWAIIMLTVLIKLAFFKLSATSYKSMANMRKMQPRMKALKERYGDDRQKLNEAMMKMYKEEKINPLGGCLPVVVQIPVFLALYWVLLDSVELRQAPFMFWITNLSAHDPYYILPVFMGVTMIIQQRLNPSPMDPIQAKVMMILPVIFTAFFAFFPAGLVLYWIVNNSLSIAQQWYITRHVINNS